LSRSIEFKVPLKLAPLDKSNARYKGAKGGRGSGKSYYFADKLLDRFIENPNLNWACMREVQKSIAKSSKKLLEDRIEFYKLHDYFEILQTEIRCKRGKGEIIFQGLQDHTVDSIKSLEGFDGVWVEESQSITEHSLDLLIPTFRKDDSELWFSWNPELRTDAIEKLFKTKENSTLIHINYTENPFCSNVIIQEADEMRLNDPEKYHHIYLGGYVDTSGNKLFSFKDVDKAMNRNGDDSGSTVIGCDVARYGDDSTVLVVRSGLWVKSILKRNKLAITETADWTNHIANITEADAVIVDTIGIGAGVHDILVRKGVFSVDGNFGMKPTDTNTYTNKRAESYFKLSNAIKRGLSLPKDDDLLEELLAIEYVFNESGKVRIEPKDKIKEKLGRSPDKADALALTYFTDVFNSKSSEFEKPFMASNVF